MAKRHRKRRQRQGAAPAASAPEPDLFPWLIGGLVAAGVVGGIFLWRKQAALNALPSVTLVPGVQSVIAPAGSSLSIAPAAGGTWSQANGFLVTGNAANGLQQVATPQGTSTPISVTVPTGSASVFAVPWTQSNGNATATSLLILPPGASASGTITDPGLISGAQAMLAAVASRGSVPGLSYVVGGSNFTQQLAVFQSYVNTNGGVGVTLITTGALDYPTFAVLLAAAAGV